MALAGGGAGRTSVLVFTMPFWTLLIAWPVLHERVRGAADGRDRAARSPASCWSSSRGTGRATSRPSCGRCCRASAGPPGRRDQVFPARPRLRPAELHRVADARSACAADVAAVAVRRAGDAVERRAGRCCCSTSASSSTAVGFLAWIEILRWLPAGTASLNMFAIPVIALLSSMVVFGERLAANEWAGIALIGAGLALITRGWRSPAAGQAAAPAGRADAAGRRLQDCAVRPARGRSGRLGRADIRLNANQLAFTNRARLCYAGLEAASAGRQPANGRTPISRMHCLPFAVRSLVALRGAGSRRRRWPTMTWPSFKLVARDGEFEPTMLEVPAGKRFRLEVSNESKTAIEFESTDLKQEKVIAPGTKATVLTINALKAGEYKFFDEFHEDDRAGQGRREVGGRTDDGQRTLHRLARIGRGDARRRHPVRVAASTGPTPRPACATCGAASPRARRSRSRWRSSCSASRRRCRATDSITSSSRSCSSRRR